MVREPVCSILTKPYQALRSTISLTSPTSPSTKTTPSRNSRIQRRSAETTLWFVISEDVECHSVGTNMCLAQILWSLWQVNQPSPLTQSSIFLPTDLSSTIAPCSQGALVTPESFSSRLLCLTISRLRPWRCLAIAGSPGGSPLRGFPSCSFRILCCMRCMEWS